MYEKELNFNYDVFSEAFIHLYHLKSHHRRVHMAGFSQGLALAVSSHGEPFCKSRFLFGTKPGAGRALRRGSQLVSLMTAVI